MCAYVVLDFLDAIAVPGASWPHAAEYGARLFVDLGKRNG